MKGSTAGLTLRSARSDEAGSLTELTLRSKAYWGYDEAFLDACRDDLRLWSDEIAERRTVVAERDGQVLGVATLEGDPPDGELGLLFVEPVAIGEGVGSRLYRHVLTEAGRLGFTRVTIESDPNSEAFYQAMGAHRQDVTRLGVGRGLPVFVAWVVRPEPAWSRAYSGGRSTVLVGNVAEFNSQFNGGVAGPDHYSCVAAFCARRPGVIVLPERVEDWWVRDVAATLGWGEVKVHSGVASEGRVSDAIRARPDLSERILSGEPIVIPWGRTGAFERLAPGPPGVLEAVIRFESKRQANELFARLATDWPGILVPAQRPIGTRRALSRELTAGARVLKREYGAGGCGTVIVTSETERRRALIRRWARTGGLLEDYVAGSGPYRDPTFDAFIDTDGDVHPVGVGLMDIDGTSYRGVTVGPGVLPDSFADTAVGFGTAVGHVLAEDGYRGWYDVDFVTARSGRLAPTEINLRLTGPAVAFHIQAALDRLRGGRHVVRTLDRLPLGARLPAQALREHVTATAQKFQTVDATLLVTIPTAAFDPVPYLGVAIAARTGHALEEAETIVRSANAALGEMFADLELSRSPSRGSRRRRARLRRSSR